MHEHSWSWIGGRMEKKCEKGHWHEVLEGYDFEICPLCGDTRGEKQFKCPYWIKSTIFSCPVCMTETIYRKRVYTYDTPKPEKWEDRNEIIESWNYCDI